VSRPKVVILGAGFGGLTAARALDRIAEVTLVDRHNFQTFLPLLYQVSTAGLAADHVAYPIRGALRKTKVKFRMGSPISVDHKNKSVKLDSSEVLNFDYLIVALGSATNDFGIKGVAENTLGMKTVNEALAIRSEIMRRFEDLCRFEDETKFSIAVIGGGPTGVEMAGAIAELKRGPLTSDSKDAAKNIDVYLVEAGSRVLPALSPKLSERTKKDLEKLSIPSESGRIVVEPTLQVTNYPDIFAIGDIAGAKGKDGRFLPMVAPVAMQQARFVAKQIERLSKNQALANFSYVDKGSMATIGRHKAVVEVKGIRIGGVVAWYMWLWLHLFYLLGGRNKIGTMADWTWNYLTFDRGNRHIMDIS